MNRTRRRLGALLLTLAALLALGVGPVAGADLVEPATTLKLVDPDQLADTELVRALNSAGVLQAWLDSAPHEPETALLAVNAGSQYDSLREQTITLAGKVALDELRAKTIADLRANEATLKQELVALITAAPTDPYAVDAVANELKSNTKAIFKLVLQTAAANSTEIAADRENLLGMLGSLHALRVDGTTAIDDLPVITLDAYVRAANDAPPSCGVTWTLLAGVGRIESRHGTLDGASVNRTGVASPPIFGPLLDGGATERLLAEEAAAEDEIEEEVAENDLTPVQRYPDLYGPMMRNFATKPPVEPTAEDSDDEDSDDEDRDDEDRDDDDSDSEDGDSEDEEEEGNGFAVIEDSDDGQIDGNVDWDRAVGPMQFIPTTWELFNTDGNNDGWTDPHNLYDATASAANYLCYLEQKRGVDRSVYIRGYNNSRAYVADVIETSDRLAGQYTLPTVSQSPAAE